MKKLITILAFFGILICQPITANADLPSYVEKEIWNDSWPIYASEFYNGKQYVVQLCCNPNPSKKNWEMRLIELKVNDNATLTDSRYWVLDDGNNKNPDYYRYNASMKEYNGKLYIYIYCNSQNYLFAFQTDSQSNETLTKLKCPVENNQLEYTFSMVKYRNSLAIISLMSTGHTNPEDTEYMNVVYTNDDPSSSNAEWKKAKTDKCDFKYVCGDNITNSFDVTNWIGVRNGKIVEELIVAQYNMNDGKINIDHFEGTFDQIANGKKEGLWNSRVISGPVINNSQDYSSGFGLKLIEGQIANNGVPTDPDNNPLQCIMAFKRKYTTGGVHQRQIICYEYDPARYSFAENTDSETHNLATNLPYGRFGICSVSIPLPDTTYEKNVEVKTYQRYISIFRGAMDNHFNKNHHYALIKSNQIKVKRSVVPTDSLLDEPEGRKICTLLGVIEGAPPTVVDNDEMYKAICGKTGSVSSVAFGSSETQSFTSEHSTTWGHTNVAGYDGYNGKLSSFSLMGGGGYEVTNSTSEEKTFKTTTIKTIRNSGWKSASSGYYIYAVPQLDLYRGQVYSPDGSVCKKGCGDVVTFIQTGTTVDFIDYRLDSVIIDPRIRVVDPLKLESWKERGVALFNPYGTNGRPLYNNSINVMLRNQTSFESTATNSSSTTKTSSWKFIAKTLVYQNESGGDITCKTSSSTTIGKDVNIIIEYMPDDFDNMTERNDKEEIYHYTLHGYFLNDPNSEVYKIYYEDLVKREMMHPDDKPFILAWNVPNTSGKPNLYPDGSGVDEIDGNFNFAAKGHKGAITVYCPQEQYIEIYSIAGMKVASMNCQEGENHFDLPAGLYVVKGTSSSIKTAVR